MKHLPVLICLLIGLRLSAQETAPYQLKEVQIRGSMPEFTGPPSGFEHALYHYFVTNIVFPPSVVEKRAEGRCYVLFTITGDGSVKDVAIARGVPDCPECDSVVLAVLLEMPRWLPGADSSETHYLLPVRFDPSDIPLSVKGDQAIYLDGEPVFPGGHTALSAYFQQELVYPKEAAEKGIGGRVYLKFVVSETGNVSEVIVTRGIPECPECDAEAVRAVKAMPLWIPNKIKGKPVSSEMSLPVKFDPKKAGTDQD